MSIQMQIPAQAVRSEPGWKPACVNMKQFELIIMRMGHIFQH